MRIAFVCGSLEIGKDGVGDYTRSLSGKLIKLGHDCVIVAIMDKTVLVLREEQQIFEDSIQVNTLRIPYINGYRVNSKLAKSYLKIWNPDYISIQYVPFSFQNKGLPLFLSIFLHKMIGDFKSHIMFHELWVGMNKEVSFRLKILGSIQKLLILSFCRKLRKSLFSTHTCLYQHQLTLLGANVSILPLISNIRLSLTSAKKMNRELKFIVFGNIHAGASIDNFAAELSSFGNQYNLELKVFFVGKTGNNLDTWLNAFKRNRIYTKVLGEQPENIISSAFSEVSIGISSTPYLLIEKSGTVAAMRDYCLPVICVAPTYTVSNYTFKKHSPYVFEYQANNLPTILQQILVKGYSFPNLDITNEFLKILSTGII